MGPCADESNKCILSSGRHHSTRCKNESGEHTKFKMQGQDNNATTVGS